jgi:ribosome recycling factor
MMYLIFYKLFSPALLERVKVPESGSNLISIARVYATGGNSLSVEPYDKSHLKHIESAIRSSIPDLNPSVDSS